MMEVAALAHRWRQQAAQYQSDGFEPAARLLTRCADELAAAFAACGEELVSLNDAARRSGHSADTLGKMVRAGTLRNFGRKHAPRLRVADLPLRPNRPGVASTARQRLTVATGAGAHDATDHEKAS